MDRIGEIVWEPDPPGISNQRWVKLIGEHPNLKPVPPKWGINPFTREPWLYHAPGNSARVFVDEKVVGTMEWAPDESNCIVVLGERQAVTPLAHNIADLLGGRFNEIRTDKEQPALVQDPSRPAMRTPRMRLLLTRMLVTAAFAVMVIGAMLHHRNRESRTPTRSPEEAAVIEIAKKAVARRWGDQPATYEATRQGDLWTVTVWRIAGYDWQGHPEFTPGGFCTVPIDTDGRVYEIMPGE
jgi:hypothetical protein